MFTNQAIAEMGRAIKYHPKPGRYYFDVALGSILLSSEDTGGAYCLLEMRVAPGKGVPRHTHTREDEALFVLSGELEAVVGNNTFVLKPGETLLAPRNIPHALVGAPMGDRVQRTGCIHDFIAGPKCGRK